MKLVLVSASGATGYLRDLLEWIAWEAGQFGVAAEVVDDVFPDDDDAAYVVLAREYFELTPPEAWPDQRLLARTIALTVAPPDTQQFEISARHAGRCATVLDINRDSTMELRRRGLVCEHFQLGYSEFVDVWGGADQNRPTDIVHLGPSDDRSNRGLAGAAPFWWDREVKLFLPPQEAEDREAADLLVGRTRRKVLADSRILVNLHRGGSRAFEWVPSLEAMANGCVVFCEHAADPAPLRPGEHFVSATPDSLGILTAAALDAPDRLAAIRTAAYDFLRTELTLRPAVAMLLDRAQALVDRATAKAQRHNAAAAHEPGPDSGGATRLPAPTAPGPDTNGTGVPAAPRDHLLEAVARVESRIARLARAIAVGRADQIVDSESYAAADPVVSVMIPMYDAVYTIGAALESVRATRGVQIEVLVGDDASSDRSSVVVERYASEYPELPLRLVRWPINLGPSATRNRLLAHVRGRFVFTLDADNGVHPTAIPRLLRALDEDPEAAFAYSIIAVVHYGDPRQPIGLVSARPWLPDLFRNGNYIDNMALLRTAELRSLGGWNESMPPWEDFELWVRYAESGMHAAFVPAILSWYRSSPYGLSQTLPHVHSHMLWERVRAAAPTVLGD